MSKSDFVYYNPDAEKRKGIAALVVVFFIGIFVGILLMKFIF